MRRIILLCFLSLTMASVESVALPPLFSSLKPGQAIPGAFRMITLPKIKSNRFELVDEDGKTVLQVTSAASAASIGIPLTASLASNSRLEWRWKIGSVLVNADMEKKTGDDFAARLYVFFDVPLSSLSILERTKIRLIRMIWGGDVPTAALCYVWDNRHPVGYSQWSPYTNRVRVMVMQSGAADVGKWVDESRDVAADFRSAFGIDAPAITGLAVGSDTDQTGETVLSWFGDVKFAP